MCPRDASGMFVHGKQERFEPLYSGSNVRYKVTRSMLVKLDVRLTCVSALKAWWLIPYISRSGSTEIVLTSSVFGSVVLSLVLAP